MGRTCRVPRALGPDPGILHPETMVGDPKEMQYQKLCFPPNSVCTEGLQVPHAPNSETRLTNEETAAGAVAPVHSWLRASNPGTRGRTRPSPLLLPVDRKLFEPHI